ncbi:general transcription factor 3C polypeptide 6-like isoform X2 [Ostrea edulis]|nr:general transcription factor 3C polypeptide 6-like isoform X2 [Ostrea edulis]
MVDLHGILEHDFIQKAEGNCKVLGIGTETPYVQLDGYTFAGKYVPPLGSYLVLEEKSADIVNPQENTSTKASLEFVACLDRKLDMNRAFISPKLPEGSVTAESSRSNTDTSQQDNQDTQNQHSNDGPANQHAELAPPASETVSEVT